MKTTEKIGKLSKKELMIIKAYREYFPDLEKACEISNTNLVLVLAMMEKNYRFKLEMEAIRVGIFSIAEKTLVNILESTETTPNHKISASKAILQYKSTLSRF
jgi:hypothetical protein